MSFEATLGKKPSTRPVSGYSIRPCVNKTKHTKMILCVCTKGKVIMCVCARVGWGSGHVLCNLPRKGSLKCLC